MSTRSNKNKFTYFITGGGTGGHIYPAIAVADALKAEQDTEKIFYIGNSKNPEKQIAENAGYQFLSVDITGMPRKISFKLFQWGVKLIFFFFFAFFFIKKY